MNSPQTPCCHSIEKLKRNKDCRIKCLAVQIISWTSKDDASSPSQASQQENHKKVSLRQLHDLVIEILERVEEQINDNRSGQSNDDVTCCEDRIVYFLDFGRVVVIRQRLLSFQFVGNVVSDERAITSIGVFFPEDDLQGDDGIIRSWHHNQLRNLQFNVLVDRSFFGWKNSKKPSAVSMRFPMQISRNVSPRRRGSREHTRIGSGRGWNNKDE